MDQSNNTGHHALVIGGSIAGLLAARILVDHFERVTIVERDRLPLEPIPRKGVIHSRHVHILLKRGLLTIEQLFPGLQAELVTAGAVVVDMASDLAWFTHNGWGVRFPSDLTMLTFTRDLLDCHVRRRLHGFAKVRFREEFEVVRLLPNTDQDGVAGAVVRSRTHGNEEEREWPADLVVDASGRGSRASQWLSELGYAPVQKTVVNAHVGYASRLYRRPDRPVGWKSLFIEVAPPTRTRAAGLVPVEGDRWLVTLAGRCRDYPPTEESGFLDFARSLPSPELYQSIKNAEPVSPIYSYRATENCLRQFHRLPRIPEHFVALGDSVCSLNPVYGQGITVAALGALTLSETLSAGKGRYPLRRSKGLSARFLTKLAKVNATPWLLATGEDFRYPETTGGRPTVKVRLMHRYMDRVAQLAAGNPRVRLVQLEVFHMLKTPAALFHPAILVRLIKRSLSGNC